MMQEREKYMLTSSWEINLGFAFNGKNIILKELGRGYRYVFPIKMPFRLTARKRYSVFTGTHRYGYKYVPLGKVVPCFNLNFLSTNFPKFSK
jgi:hypothetical protein